MLSYFVAQNRLDWRMILPFRLLLRAAGRRPGSGLYDTGCEPGVWPYGSVRFRETCSKDQGEAFSLPKANQRPETVWAKVKNGG